MGWIRILASWAALGLGPNSALATLGEPVASLERDQIALTAAHRRSATRANYAWHELDDGGITVREYVSNSGVVFGLAWSGLTHPRLDTLLGAYFADYQAAAARAVRRPGRRRQLVRGTRVIVQKWGHPRDLRGRAYDPSLLPLGVSPDEIK